MSAKQEEATFCFECPFLKFIEKYTVKYSNVKHPHIFQFWFNVFLELDAFMIYTYKTTDRLTMPCYDLYFSALYDSILKLFKYEELYRLQSHAHKLIRNTRNSIQFTIEEKRIEFIQLVIHRFMLPNEIKHYLFTFLFI
jgi:hypothetical protein